MLEAFKRYCNEAVYPCLVGLAFGLVPGCAAGYAAVNYVMNSQLLTNECMNHSPYPQVMGEIAGGVVGATTGLAMGFAFPASQKCLTWGWQKINRIQNGFYQVRNGQQNDIEAPRENDRPRV